MYEMMEQLLEVLKDVAPWITIGSVVIEFTPIKINPWTWIAKWIGKAMIGDRLDKLEKDLQSTKDAIDKKDAKDARAAILHFGDTLIYYPDRKISKDRFDEVVQRITDYDKYCEEHPEFPNHMTEQTSKLILSEYQRRMIDHEFL